MPPCTLNTSPKCPTSSQQNRVPPKTSTYHLPSPPAMLSAEDLLAGQHPPPQYSKPRSAVLDCLQTEMFPSTPTYPAPNNTPTTYDPTLPSPPQ